MTRRYCLMASLCPASRASASRWMACSHSSWLLLFLSVPTGRDASPVTPIAVQTHDRRGKNHQAYLWQYGCPGGGVVFDYQPGRSRAGPARFLGKFAGILQTDGYAAYDAVGGPGMVHAGCWAHARRKFF